MKLAEVMCKYGISRQALFIALKNNRLKGTKINGRWHIQENDMVEYLQTKYDRKFSKINGRNIFDPELGTISVIQAAKMLGHDRAHIYHAIRKGKLSHKRTRSSYVLDRSEVEKYQRKDHRCFQKSQ